jgi:hypothetical protein
MSSQSSPKRPILALLVVVVAALGLAAPASASFDRHFTVITNTIESHPTADGFRFHDQLLQAFNRSNQVGNDRGHCRGERVKVRCHIRVHLNGEVGGLGDIFVSGNLGAHDGRLNVTGGTDDFDGVAGKVVLRGAHDNRVHFDLTR